MLMEGFPLLGKEPIGGKNVLIIRHLLSFQLKDESENNGFGSMLPISCLNLQCRNLAWLENTGCVWEEKVWGAGVGGSFTSWMSPSVFIEDPRYWDKIAIPLVLERGGLSWVEWDRWKRPGGGKAPLRLLLLGPLEQFTAGQWNLHHREGRVLGCSYLSATSSFSPPFFPILPAWQSHTEPSRCYSPTFGFPAPHSFDTIGQGLILIHGNMK